MEAKQKTRQEIMSHPFKKTAPHLASVIIPAYNAQDTIAACVDAVLHQDSPGIDLEVIVVDDGSTDATPDILKTFERVQYVRQPNAGPAAARNHGAARARGSVLFFTDADCIPCVDWVRRIMTSFAEESISAAAGSYGIANPRYRLARCVHQEICYRHQHRMGKWIDVFGSYNAALRRDVFERVGGFDASYRYPSGEDNDLSYRLRRAGIRIRFIKDARVNHAHPVSVRRYLYEQYRHGLWRVKMYRAFPGMMKGDGYTFWKDSLEVGLTFGIAGMFAAAVHPAVGPAPVLIAVFLWLVFEVFFSWRMGLRNFSEMVFFGGVMVLRSWARTAGFLRGLILSLSAAERS